MPTTRLPLSASPLLIGVASAAFTVIHNNNGGVGAFDDVFLTIHNPSASSFTITFYQDNGSGTTTTLDLSVAVPGNQQGLFYALGYPIPNGITLVAKSSGAFALTITGYAIRNT